MANAKQVSKRKRRSKALPVLGAAGLSFSLASAASGGPAVNIPTPNAGVSNEITLAEEEISDVSLATFYVFDKEYNRSLRPGVELVRGGGCGGGCGGGGGKDAEAVAVEVAVVEAAQALEAVAVEAAVVEAAQALEAVQALEGAQAMDLADAQAA